MKRNLKYFVIYLLILSSLLGINVNAQTNLSPYYSYQMNAYGESVAAPDGYTPSEKFYGTELGMTLAFNQLTDLYYDGENYFYILDSGNGRIVVLDRKMKFVRTIDDILDDGEKLDITGAEGMTVDKNGTIYIADTTSNRLLICDSNGNVLRKILRPDEALAATSAPFDVQKVAVDNTGLIYTVTKSINQGVLVFDKSGEFKRFFGSVPVQATWEVIYNYIRKRFMTRDQIQGLMQNTPVTVTNIDVDENDFVYIITPNDKTSNVQTSMLRKLNQAESNILKGKSELLFGDDEWDDLLTWQGRKYTDFADVDVDDYGYITLLDKGRGKVYQYSDNGIFVTSFGTMGDQTGNFIEPVAIENMDGNIYVADKTKNCIFKFVPTEYLSTIHESIDYMNDNDNDRALVSWKKVLNQCTNNTLAYYNLGVLSDTSGNYKQAMDYFKTANFQQEYSDSYREYRKEFVQNNFIIIILILLLLIALTVAVSKLIKRFSAVKEGNTYSKLESKNALPLYCMMHPVDGFRQMQYRKYEALPLAVLFVILWFVIKTVAYFCTGFIFNANRSIDFNFGATLVGTIGIYILFVIANWAICTLFDGKGNLKQIICTVAYSLIPILISQLFVVLLSNIVTANEASFLSLIGAIGYLWAAVMLLCGLYAIHQYSFSKTLVSTLATILGILVIAFLMIMFYSLLHQAWNFVEQIFLEVSKR